MCAGAPAGNPETTSCSASAVRYLPPISVRPDPACLCESAICQVVPSSLYWRSTANDWLTSLQEPRGPEIVTPNCEKSMPLGAEPTAIVPSPVIGLLYAVIAPPTILACEPPATCLMIYH